ncbi:DUF4129 domain-containing protein [Mycobacterium helveticum]|uniref:DUF4129 domain-containing protein n=1 Tax=Mycobacterium helveticum TaxID=2592811 RepID=A0A557XYX3_9MYCO|nr:DUF4129 domain-containing protein [Mycobacterium helveticum]TVS87541.1 DUF4129 domain-containing protein [Mycobacterium helveticum]TVS91381.1 DUF4129 domain-containing protein [Mycobacterium helveticum]
MPGSDKPTARVLALIVLLLVVAAALRGYLPAHDRAPRTDAGSNPAAWTAVVAALAGTVTLLAIAVVARLRDPRGFAPGGPDLPALLGTGTGRPGWRVLLIGLGVIAGLLLVLTLLTRVAAGHDVTPPAPGSTSASQRPAHAGSASPRQPPQGNSGNMSGVLIACTLPLLPILVVGTILESRRRWRAKTPGLTAVDDRESPAPPTNSGSLVRAAERGLAEMADLRREPREAIIACYAAMERELANVPGAVPQDFDTPTEVLARAVERHALHADNAIQLVDLFGEARFSPHVMNEGHRDVAVRLLQLVLGELRSASHA